MGRLLALGALACGLFATHRAFAQSPALGGDRGADAGDPSGFRLVAPLRLSLEGSVVPIGGGFPNCGSREDDVGNSVGGIPVQHFAAFALTPRLVLSGFTQIGCPIDAGIGGALTYAVPVAHSIHLVFGGGIYAAPGQLPLFGGMAPAWARAASGQNSAFGMATRADLVWKTASDRTYNVGVETLGRGIQTISFGGGF